MIRFPDISNAFDQLHEFIDALYENDDLVEIRPIETWEEDGKKHSRVLFRHRMWATPDEIRRREGQLRMLNHKHLANIFIGVNPRNGAGGTKTHVEVVRSVWTDIDDVQAAEAVERWSAVRLPPPSIFVNSGHGVHAYWLLEKPFVIQAGRDRARFEAMLQSLYGSLQADSVSDVSRVLRLPGTWNCKSARNGIRPLPCTLMSCDRDCRYPLDTFVRWFDATPARTVSALKPDRRSRIAPTGLILDSHPAHEQVQKLIDRLDEPSKDRSRRDFAVVCELLRLGVDENTVLSLVTGRSKFATAGDSYTVQTISNAMLSVRG